MMKRESVLGLVAVAILLATPLAFAQNPENTNSCPQLAADVDFFAINATALLGGELFGMQDDGADAGDPEAVPSTYVEVEADGIPDLLQLAMLEFMIKDTDFYDADICALYQSNYAAAYADLSAAGLTGILTGGDEIIAALITFDTGWAPLIEQFIVDNGMSLTMTIEAYDDAPEVLAAGVDTDNDSYGTVSLTNLDEWDNLDATWEGGDADAWYLPGKPKPTTAAQGIARNLETYAQYATDCLAGAMIVVTVSPSLSERFIGQKQELSASSNANVPPNFDPVETEFTWASSDESVAKVTSLSTVTFTNDTAEVRAIDLGYAVITATGVVHPDVSGSATIAVVTPTWVDLCQIDDAFQGMGSAFAAVAGPLFGLPGDFSVWDIEGFVGDGIPDSWQLALLAYTLCKESEFYTPYETKAAPDAATVVGQFLTNYAEIKAMCDALEDTPDYIDGLGPHMVSAGSDIALIGATATNPGPGTELNTLETVCTNVLIAAGLDDPPGTAAWMAANIFIGDATAGVPMQTTGGTLAGMGPVLVDGLGSESDFAEIGPVLGDVDHFMTGMWGLSTEMKGTFTAMFEGAGLLGSGGAVEYINMVETDVEQGLMVYAAVFGFVVDPVNGLNGFCPVTCANYTNTLAAAGFVQPEPTGSRPASYGNMPAVTEPDPLIYGKVAKLADEPFAGAGDWDGDGLTNAEVAGGVDGAGGGMNDFIDGATGEGACGDFWPGNPGVPAAGLVGLGILSGILALAFARRKK